MKVRGVFLTAFLLLGMLSELPTVVQSIGVCYGRDADNLPQPSDVVNLYKSNKIDSIRLYQPDQDALQALRGSNLKVLLDVANDDLQTIASDPNQAATWVQTNIQPYTQDISFKYIAVGNEVIPGSSAQYVLPAMQNIHNALSAAGINNIKVSTSVSQAVVSGSFPPSAGAFTSQTRDTMQPIVNFLSQNGAPLLANIYSYFAYIYDEADNPLDYALFTYPGAFVTDGDYKYQNLFDAITDTVYSALAGMGGGNVEVVVSESGWPSAGGDPAVANVTNAQTHNQNLINHVGQGTPRKPGAIETYVFAMFNEDLKPNEATERHFGLFYPNQQPVYPINFS